MEPLRAPGVEGVRITQGERVDTVIFKRFGGMYALGKVQSDAQKVVIRQEGGAVRAFALWQGTTLRYRGQELVAEPQPVSRAVDL
jgi:predicted membrane GTPase involved in stress response